MDFGISIVRSILDGGKPAYRDFLARSVPENVITGDAKIALDFISGYISDYGLMPDVKFVEGKLGLSIPANINNTTTKVWIDELITNHIGVEVQKAATNSLELLQQNKNIDSLDSLKQAVFDIQRLQLGEADARVTSLLDEGKNVWDYYQRTQAGERGILTPWPSINESTMGFGPEELILIVARSGLGKCVDSATEITDPITGLVHMIEEVVRRPELGRVWSWGKSEGIHSRPITAKVDTGRKACRRITFSSGRSIVVTPEHPLLTAEGWKRADEFIEGMTAALPARTALPEVPETLPDHHVDTLAIMLADGSCTSYTPKFTKRSKSIVSIASECAKYFGVELHGQDGGNDWSFAQPTGSKTKNPVKALLERHGLDGVLSKNKKVPDSVFRLNERQLSRFLSVFWMCDGYVDATGPCIVLASETLVRQIQSLLLRLGIQSKVEYKKAKCNGESFDAWRVRVYSLSLDTFSKKIPLWDHKGRALVEHLGKKRNTNVGYPRVSEDFVQRISALAKSKAGRWGEGLLCEVAKRLGRVNGNPKRSPYFGARDLFGDHNSLWLRPFKVFCEVYGVASEFEWLWSSDIFWDVVTEIEDVGERKIYDLTVEPTSCFIANDIIVHNTWASLIVANYAWQGYDVYVKKNGKTEKESRKHKVLYVTTEMSKLRIALRFYALAAKLPYGDLRHARLNAFQEEKLKKYALEAVDDSGIKIVGGNFDFRVENLAAAIDEAKPDLVIIDGIYLIKVPGKDRMEQAANAFAEVKRLTVSKKVPIVVTSQFNREVKQNQAATARAESIALTDSAVWHSTLIFGMVQTDDNKKEGRMQMKQLKVRDGSGDDFELNWRFNDMNFDEITVPGSANDHQITDLADTGLADTSGSYPF